MLKSILRIGCAGLVLLAGVLSPGSQNNVYSETANNHPAKSVFIDFSLSPLRDRLAAVLSNKDGFSGIKVVDVTSGTVLEMFEAPDVSDPVWSSDGKQLFFRAITKELDCGQELPPEAFSKLAREATLVYKYDFDKFTPVVEGLIVHDLMYSKFLQSPIIIGMEELFEPGADWDDWKARRRPDLWMIDLGDQQLRRLTSENSLSGSPVMSTDGTLVFYNLLLPREEKCVQFVLDLRTMGKKPLDLGRFFDSFLALSKDNRYLLFTKNPIVEGEVQPKGRCYLYDLEKGQETQLLGEEFIVCEGAFLENGKTVALLAKGPGEEEFNIWIVRNRLGPPEKITDTGPPSGGKGKMARYDETNLIFTNNKNIYVVNVVSGEKRVVYTVSK